eukprot:9484891-Pyramimonas_sp.AAC.1
MAQADRDLELKRATYAAEVNKAREEAEAAGRIERAVQEKAVIRAVTQQKGLPVQFLGLTVVRTCGFEGLQFLGLIVISILGLTVLACGGRLVALGGGGGGDAAGDRAGGGAAEGGEA